jgi:glutamate transport system substrate-binding protein
VSITSRPRLVGAVLAAVLAGSLVSCSSAAAPAASSAVSSAASAGSSALATATSAAAGAGSSGSSAAGSSAAGSTAAGSSAAGSSAAGSGAASSGGAATTVPQITGSGSGEIDQATYDSVIAGAPKADDATVSANAWAAGVKSRGTLKVGGTDSGPLFSLLDPATGKLTGFDAGLSQMLAQYIIGEPKTALTVTTVDTRETLLQNNTVDTVFATYTITPARATKVAFAGPYFSSGAAIMVKKDNTSINSVKDLAGKNVATESNSTAVTALKAQAPTAKLQLYAEDAQCQAAVQQGRADAYVLDQSILISDAISNPAVKVVGEPFTVDPYGIGVTKSDPSAKQFVDAWLQKIYADGSWAKLWKATIGTVVSGDAPTPPKIGSVPGS